MAKVKKTKKAQVGDVLLLSKGFSCYKMKKSDIYNGDQTQLKQLGKWVVTSTAMQGGGNDGYGGSYPDGWNVRARELSGSGLWNPEGREITFYMSGCFTCQHETVDVVGKMSMEFAREQEDADATLDLVISELGTLINKGDRGICVEDVRSVLDLARGLR